MMDINSSNHSRLAKKTTEVTQRLFTLATKQSRLMLLSRSIIITTG